MLFKLIFRVRVVEWEGRWEGRGKRDKETYIDRDVRNINQLLLVHTLTRD